MNFAHVKPLLIREDVKIAVISTRYKEKPYTTYNICLIS